MDEPAIESECDISYHTPEVQRQKEIAEIINKYGVSCVLREISKIYKKGRKEAYELKEFRESIKEE